jgi:hypothetical protein
MSKLFTREQAKDWLRQNGLKCGKSITNAFIVEIKDVLQEAFEGMETHLNWCIVVECQSICPKEVI